MYAVVKSGDKSHFGFEAVLSNVLNLSQISAVFDRATESDPGTRLEGGSLSNTKKLRHVLDIDKSHFGSRIDVEKPIQRHENIGLPLRFDVDKALHHRLSTTALECRRDGQLALGAHALFDSLHDGKDNLALLALLASDRPDTRVVDTREKQAFGNNSGVTKALATETITVVLMALAEQLSLLLSVHARFQLSAAVELAVPSVIIESRRFSHVIGVLIVDEVANLFVFLFLVLGFVLVVDDGFDIEEGISPISAAFSTMALQIKRQ